MTATKTLIVKQLLYHEYKYTLCSTVFGCLTLNSVQSIMVRQLGKLFLKDSGKVCIIEYLSGQNIKCLVLILNMCKVLKNILDTVLRLILKNALKAEKVIPSLIFY